MESTHNQGFTLIELLVAIAVLGILLGIGVPSFTEAVKESRISGQYNTMVGSLYLARSEAVKGPGQVTVCPRKSDDPDQCGTKDDWSNGWIVFIDNTTVAGESEANIDTDDLVISIESPLSGSNVIKAIGSSTNSASDAEEVAFVRYLQDGGTLWNSGTFAVCDTNRGSASSRAINLVLTGDIRRGRIVTGSKAPRDVFNQPISDYCPEPSS
ncbi:MAG: GspH/FimT family pseudopilin [Granulosicoccus sp.]